MSHPNPLHDRSNEYPSDDYGASPKSRALAKKAGKKVKPFAEGVKGLTQMMNQPASKHWFARVPKK